MTLSLTDFPAFFAAVHDQQPFTWQVELAERVGSGAGWPAALDVPTGLGKTAALDVAVFALALQAELPAAARTARTRTFLVVDRRVIVDQAHERACRIVAALDNGDGVLAEVSRRLALLAGPGLPALTATRMRGGVTWSSRWLAAAAQPALITGTVDQLGSRLLFRGYGTSQTMRPVDAALCGTDSLLLLDEAHMSQPFLRTVRAVVRYEAQADSPVLAHRPMQAVLLSAVWVRSRAQHCSTSRPRANSLPSLHRSRSTRLSVAPREWASCATRWLSHARCSTCCPAAARIAPCS
jgi:CRISPR-associated endonuclease/helicase Cas3